MDPWIFNRDEGKWIENLVIREQRNVDGFHPQSVNSIQINPLKLNIKKKKLKVSRYKLRGLNLKEEKTSGVKM